MPGPKPDRRIQRTRQLLHEALITLILEKGYDAITVQDILERANLGRSTFYAHYQDKEALLLSGFQELFDATAPDFTPYYAELRKRRDLAANETIAEDTLIKA